MSGISLEDVRAVVHRLFLASGEATSLRKEDEQKCRQLVALLPRLAKVASGAHLVDAAAGKASVGLVAAELLPIGQLTVIERDPARIAACHAAEARRTGRVPVAIVRAGLAEEHAWPERPDAVVGLHACGPASDVLIDQAIRTRARHVLVVPCCYGDAIPFAARARAMVAAMPHVTENLIRRRLVANLVDSERVLRLEAAGYETRVDELVGATVTAHNLLLVARRTDDTKRIARASARLEELHGAAAPR